MVAVLKSVISEVCVTPVETLFGTSYTVTINGESVGYASVMENGNYSTSSFCRLRHQAFTSSDDAIGWVIGQYQGWIRKQSKN